MDEEWFREKLANLQIKETRADTLNEIRTHLYEAGNLETQVASNFLTSPEIFECLDDDGVDDRQRNLAADILSICMSSLDLDQINIPRILEKSLRHKNPKIQELALNEIQKIINKSPADAHLDTEVTRSIIMCLESEESCVSISAIKVLSKILLSEYNNVLIQSEFLAKLEKSDIVRCRVYEVAINLAKSSLTMNKQMEEVLDKAMSELNGNDVLLQLNVLELFTSLAEQNHGLEYLRSKNIFENMSKRVMEVERNPLDNFLMPGIMKFFGKIAFHQPEMIIGGYPQLVEYLFQCFTAGDLTILPTAFDTLSNLAGTGKGKIILEEKFSYNIQDTFREFRNLLRNLPADLKNRCFDSLEVIFHVEGEVTNQVSEIARKWASHFLGSSDMQFLLDFCKNPFPDIKASCIGLVKALCSYPWGVLAMRDTAGFVEYLLDRRLEFDKDVKMLKYEIIEILASSTAFDAQTLLQLKRYVEQGPHFVEGIVEVAVEGGE